MTYEVLVENLRAAAGRYRSVASSLGTDGVDITHVDPGSLGHVELAAWLEAVDEQCHNATMALHDGAAGLADSLTSTAARYETTDDDIGSLFRSPLGGGPPFGPPSGPPFGPPLAPPFAPTTGGPR
jgi:hypothetical protein